MGMTGIPRANAVATLDAHDITGIVESTVPRLILNRQPTGPNHSDQDIAFRDLVLQGP